MRNRISSLTVLMASACLLLVSCQKEHLSSDLGSIGGVIKVKVSAGDMSGTRSGTDVHQVPNRVISSCDGDIQLEEYVSDYPGEMCPDYTRGAAITTNAHNPITGKTFYIEGWLGQDIVDPVKGKDAETADKNDYHFIKKNSVTYDGSKWNFSAENFWRNGIPTTFWSYVPPTVGTLQIKWPGSETYGGSPFTTYASTDKPSDAAQKVLSFNYTLPSPDGSDNDAYALQDFLVAYNNETRSLEDGEITGGKSEYFDIHFYHPLSAVKFMVGDISGDDDPDDNEYVNITKVELVGVKTTGSFTATGSNTMDCVIACNSTFGSATYSQAATRAQIGTDNNGLFTAAGSDYLFFMIPQDVSDVTVRLTMTRNKKNITYESDGTTIHSVVYGEPIIFTREASLSGVWEPGKYYTYTINSTVYFGGEEVTMDKDQIEVSDSEKVKVNSDGSFEFQTGGKDGFNEWVAPLPTKGVNIIKLTFTHSYKCASQKSARRIWLENATVNPDWDGPDDTDPHFINPYDIKSYNSDLVSEAYALPNASTYWGSPVYYTGYLGDYTESGGKYPPTGHDNHMNDKGTFTDVESVMYFYLGGQFDYVKIHFDYFGDAGDGKWSAKVPMFNITSVIE